MSTTPESGSPEFELDLDLHFLPAWAKKPPTENQYAKFEAVEEERPRRRGRWPEGRDQRRSQPHPSDARASSEAGPGPRREGRHRPQGKPRREGPQAPPPPPLELSLTFIPEEKGVESLARQIRLTGRAYPLFDIAHLILKKPERYHVRLSTIKKQDDQPAQPLYLCDLDESLWLSEQEAMEHVLNKFFSTFYQTEKIPTDPPKGIYTFVAQCGMSGTILGPPNYHDYQTKLRRLHAERFSRMPFEVFKSRIKIVRDEAVVKQWLEDQSWKTEYICLNVPETIKLQSREEVEKHFRATHLPNVIKQVESHTFTGTAAQSMPCRALHSFVRRNWDEQMRFPLKVVNVLSQQFAGHGLQFFKVNKTVTHVAVARPRYLDLDTTPVSEGVRQIVEFIQKTPNCNRRRLLEALAPAPSGPAGTPTEAAAAAPIEPGAEPPHPEAAAVISNLHWLIHEGHVIEFANGAMELAKKPAPRPAKPEPAQKSEPAQQPEQAQQPEATEGDAPESSQSAPQEPQAQEAPQAPASASTQPESSQPPQAEGQEPASTEEPVQPAASAVTAPETETAGSQPPPTEDQNDAPLPREENAAATYPGHPAATSPENESVHTAWTHQPPAPQSEPQEAEQRPPA